MPVEGRHHYRAALDRHPDPHEDPQVVEWTEMRADSQVKRRKPMVR